MLPRRLPPLNAVRAFEAAARLMSFKEAAEELHVTPQAISQQIKVLEAWSRAPVFVRGNRAIELTAAGKAFLPVASQALDDLEAGAAGLSARSRPEIVTISSPASFAVRWLIPRLATFRRDLPHLDYRLKMSTSLPNLSGGDFDVAIHWRDASGDRSLRSDLLMALDIVPVCSPALLEGHDVSGPEDLLRYPLIRHSSAPELWSTWFRAAGCPDPDVSRGPEFENDLFIVEAAIEGFGVCLVPRTEAARDLDAGRLVVPLDIVLTGAERFYLVCLRARQDDDAIVAFRDWLCGQFAAEGAGAGSSRTPG